MTLTRLRTTDGTQDGKAWVDSGQWKWYHSNGSESFVPNEWTVHRMISTIPRGAVITSAIWRFEYGHKDENTIPQTTNLTTVLSPNHTALPRTNDTYFGPATTSDDFPVSPNVRIGNHTSTINYTVVTTGVADYHTVDITTSMQTLIAREDYQPGAHFALLQKCTAESGDMNINTGNAYINVTYTVPESEERRTAVNMMLDSGGESGYPGFPGGPDATNTFFGQFQPATVARDATRAKAGGYSWCLTTPVLTGAQESHVNWGVQRLSGESWAFSGWVYVPAAIITDVNVGWWFGAHTLITLRDQWVPFSVLSQAGSDDVGYPEITIHGAVPVGTKIWCDELNLTITTFPQAPFTGNNPKGPNKEFKFTTNPVFDPSVRESKARTGVKPAGTMLARMKWVKNADNLWVRADSARQSLTWDDIPDAVTWNDLNAARTWDDWEALGGPTL